VACEVWMKRRMEKVMEGTFKRKRNSERGRKGAPLCWLDNRYVLRERAKSSKRGKG